MSRPFQAFGVFNPSGRLVTARHNRADAEDAVQIIGGSRWQTEGYTVEPITVRRGHHAPTTHPDMHE